MEKKRSREEDYWFNVGGISGMLAIFIVILPLMFMATFVRDMQSATEKILYGIVPMLSYYLILLWKSSKLVDLCEKLAIKEMEKHKS